MTDAETTPTTSSPGGSTDSTVEPQVKHMKWWGWGVEGVSFRHDDKPKFAAFVQKVIDLDVTTPGNPMLTFEELPIPEPKVGDDVLARLRSTLGEQHVHTDPMSRIVHTYGKSLRDLVKIRAGILPRVPDVVVYPADEDQVQAVVDLLVESDAVIIPFGGGSNIAGSLEPPPAETRTVVSLDMGRLDRVVDVDEDSGLARIQAGVLGPDMEKQLNARGWTMGHFPDSFTHSTLGGWVATRSSGMQSDKYGDIADITRGLRVVQPGKKIVIRPLPSTSTGPSVREMILGSEGRLGVITEVTVNVHRLPEERLVLGYLFPSWSAGLAAMHAISVSDASPSITRVSDAGETAFSFATRKKSSGLSSVVSNGLMAVLKRRGWDLDQVCLSFIGYEGGKDHVARQRSMVKKIVSEHGGIVLGKGPGELYDQKKFDTPYIRDFLLDRGAAGDVSETAAPWSKLKGLYDNVVASAHRAFDQIGVKGWIMCHLSHSYHSGACLYFTFAFKQDPHEAIAQYDVVKSAIQQAFIESGGTLSHHHAVGTEHARWLADDLSPAGAELMGGLFDAADPGHHFNPGKITG
ncbi:alkyldihydroxyacetonephosphate synthase [Friedmanniella endophytica]|uniref:Alkyldihydroxyacetonephosphate synthase n=1 Tax=Microlunatus kandeliicorticis TaxID=1759536 RepID=A0A7W3P5D8_9ACTN|nr:FAD-binding oxidoreductase [Microlunatus kandeliicorticis]MBA8793767.1 alkyldihydroxyacetonephosphate synthase [Microlunatus kandeliicorticis]